MGPMTTIRPRSDTASTPLRGANVRLCGADIVVLGLVG